MVADANCVNHGDSHTKRGLLEPLKTKPEIVCACRSRSRKSAKVKPEGISGWESNQLTAQVLGRSTEKRGGECPAAAQSSFRPLKVFPSKGLLEQRIELLLVHRYSPAPRWNSLTVPTASRLSARARNGKSATARGLA